MSLGGFDPHGRWAFFCQTSESFDIAPLVKRFQSARSTFLDRAFAPYFAQSNGETAAVDALLASSPNGRYVVLLRHQAPELLDIETGKSQSLAARDLDMRSDVLPGDSRSIAFSASSDKVAFLVHEKHPRVIILDLHDASESTVTPLGDTVWRIGFDASSQYLVSQEVLEDSNRNGHLSWPLPEQKLSDARCRAPIPAFPAFLANGDTAETTIAPVKGGRARKVPGFVTGLGHSVIVKAPNGALFASDGIRTHSVGSADCNAQIVAISPEYSRILVGCRDGKGRSALEVDSLTDTQKLDLDIPYSSVDRTVPESTPFVPVYSGARSGLVDLASARLHPLEDRDQVLAQGQAGIIIRRGSRLILYNPSSNKQTQLVESVPAGTRLVMGAGVVAFGNRVASASEGRVLGDLGKPALALDSNGCGLVALNESQKTDPFPRGPLGWSCPAK